MKVYRFTFNSLALASLALVSAAAWANSGSVSQLSGTLSVQKADGSVRILSQRSEIKSGDTVATQKDSYAQIKFSDGGTITLKPNTSVKIEQFQFQQAEPEKDSMIFGLLKGGLRAVTGLVGKRGNQDAYRLGTATATIGIRGTALGVEDCLTTSCTRTGEGGNIEGAVYVSVTDGEIIATNSAGSQSLIAGQFAAIDGPNSRPRFLSSDPGLQFTPPATFIQSIMTGAAVNTGKNNECVVRR